MSLQSRPHEPSDSNEALTPPAKAAPRRPGRPPKEVEEEIRANAFKLMSKQSQIAAKAAGRAVDVAADDFEE